MLQKISTLEDAARLWQAGEKDQARTIIKKLTQAQPQNEQVWLWQARTAESTAQQLEALDRVLALNPHNAIAQRVLQERYPKLAQQRQKIAQLLAAAYQADNPHAQEHRFLQVIQLEPANRPALDGLLEVYAASGQWQKGFELIGTARRVQPSAFDLIERQIDFGVRGRNLNVLLELEDVLLQHSHISAEHLLRVSEVFARDKRYEIVARLLERAQTLDDQNQTVLYGLARAYEITKRPGQAKAALQKIADLDRKSKIGATVMDRLLEADPYVPRSMRENTLLAMREAVGLTLPLIFLALADNALSLISPERWLGIILGFLGAYGLVSATSSHEQAIFKSLFPEGLDQLTRQVLGGVSSVVLIVSLYLVMPLTFSRATETDQWVEQACVDWFPYLADAMDYRYSDEEIAAIQRQGQVCARLRIMYDRYVQEQLSE